jgi:hypothetical protein
MSGLIWNLELQGGSPCLCRLRPTSVGSEWTSTWLCTSSYGTYGIPKLSSVMCVGSHKMHIFTANIPTFHSGYRRYLHITNEFHEFCWSTISGTLDDGKASYGPKSMHNFNMSKIRHSHREYDTRVWCSTKHEPNQALVPFQTLLCQCVKEGRCTGYPMPKVGAT